MAQYIALLVLVLYVVHFTVSSRIRIDENGYKGILIALPHNVKEEERGKIIKQLELTLWSSSNLLQVSTKGRSYISEVSFLVPENWYIPYDDDNWNKTSFNSSHFPEAGATLTTDDADVVVTEDGQYPYVLHQDGCGRQGLRIVLPKNFVLGNGEKGNEFVRLWSEYRYGLFPEGGFHNDDKYPRTYRSLTQAKYKITGCSFWPLNSCVEGQRCDKSSLSSSLMDQLLNPPAQLFCEGDVSLGPRHNPESPSKHNLMCREEGTWFTVLRNPDFAHGKNAAPKYLGNPHVSFRFTQERKSPRFIVAIDISAAMKQSRYHLAKIAFSHFVFSTVPEGSELTLLTFSNEGNAQIVKPKTRIEDDEARIRYLESQPLPEDVYDSEGASIESLLDEIFQTITTTEDNATVSSNIVIITSESYLNDTRTVDLKQNFLESESRMHVLLFNEDNQNNNHVSQNDIVPLYDLCFQTGGELISLDTDLLGNLYRGLSKTVKGPNKEILILQEYLQDDDDFDLNVTFMVDASLKKSVKVFLTFIEYNKNPLYFTKTFLQTPSGQHLIFSKKELISAWVVNIPDPESGEYILMTRRLEDATSPVLLTVASSSTPDEEPITVNVWVEILSYAQMSPPPVKIFAEIKSGMNPVKNAEVVASVHHPDNEISELILLDDGLGDVDVTESDGIYSKYFTNFTSAGCYNVYVKVFQGENATSEIVKGPGDLCCGSFFSAVGTKPTGRFQRESGPFVFYVTYTQKQPDEDLYPPSRVTDLRLTNTYDDVYRIQWTAVGDDYDFGVAKTYELKVFSNRAIIQNRFEDSGLEVYSEEIETTERAMYGVTLNHAFKFPDHTETGVYYLAIRAVDDAGNAGLPSNIVPVWVEQRYKNVIQCDDKSPRAEKLQNNNPGRGFVHTAMTCAIIPVNVLVPVISLILSLMIINTI